MERRSARRGQSATEYMLVLSVIVTSLVAAGYMFVPSFQQGVGALAVDVRQALATGDVGGVGFDRSRGFSAGSGAASQGLGAVGPSSIGSGASSHPSSQNSTDSGGGNGGGLRGQPGTPDAPVPLGSGQKAFAPKDDGGHLITLDSHDS